MGTNLNNTRRVVFVCCDGLGIDWVTADRTPVLHALGHDSLWCADHRAVFPSVTRVSAASVATGCHPARHGLHGNRMGLVESGEIVVRDVGRPDFLGHMRRATGATLRVPTLAECTASHGGFVAFSNVSPGAAYFLDPDHFGHVYHRAGSFAPGGGELGAAEALDVSHDLAGDWAMTRRFCTEVLQQKQPAIATLWLANPDLTLHGAPLGSPAHLEALRQTERCVAAVAATVAELRRDGIDILLVIGSDHGQETIGDSVDLDEWLAGPGLEAELQAGEIAMAGQGTAALFYAAKGARDRLLLTLQRAQAEPWTGEIVVSEDLNRLGHAATGGVVAAINMARRDAPNVHGVRGLRWTVAEQDKPTAFGCGQHGGWGPDETRPFLLLNGADVVPGRIEQPTSLVDIAPTFFEFLRLPSHGMDGVPLLQRKRSPVVRSP
jgi:hypothetical protein